MSDLEQRLRSSLNAYADSITPSPISDVAPTAGGRSSRVLVALAAAALLVIMVPVLWLTRDRPDPASPVAPVSPITNGDPVIGAEYVGTDPVPFPTGMESGFQGYSATSDDLGATSLTVHSGLDMEARLILTWDPELARRVPDNAIVLDSRFTNRPESVTPIGVRLGAVGPTDAVLSIDGTGLENALRDGGKNARLAREEITTFVNSLVFLDRSLAEQALRTSPDVIIETFELDGVTISRRVGLPSSAVQLRLSTSDRWNGAALSVLREHPGGPVAKQLLTLDDGRMVISHSPLLQPAPSTGAVTVDDVLLGLSWTIVDESALDDTDGGRMLDVVDENSEPTTLTVVNYDTD